jgi:outer membrane protein assembly factor BamB
MTTTYSGSVRVLALGCILTAGLMLLGTNTEPLTAADPPAPAGKSDSVMFGGTPARNMVNLVDKNLPAVPLDVKERVSDPQDPDKFVEKVVIPSDAKLLWKAELGSKSYGGPTIANGRIYVGTNNAHPRNDRDIHRNKQGEIEPLDKGVLMCFDEKTGKFLWQSVNDKLESGRVNDWPDEGVCSTPTVEGDRVYFVSNRCVVVCLDANGFANGNQGFQGEKYKSDTDADIIWEYDMMKELQVFPHNMSAGCPLIVGDILFVHTANGVDDGHLNLPSPNAPSFIALNKNTGKLIWQSNLPGRNIMHGQWSNPAYAEIDGVRQVIFPGGDGWIYSFVPETGELIWKFDGNPKNSVYELGGAGTRSDYIGTPVIYDNKIYIGLGQDPEHSTGISHFWCIGPKKGTKGDISKVLETRTPGPDGKDIIGEKPNPNSHVVWHFGGEESRSWSIREFKFGRTMSTACIVDDILYISELCGYLHCMNAQTGEHYWRYDTKAAIWGSPYYADGKVYLATDGSELFVFRHSKEPEKIDELDIKANNQREARKLMKEKQQQVADKYLISKVALDAPVRSTPIVANGVLYVMTESSLYAFQKK